MATINETGATVKTLNEYLGEVRAAYLAVDPAWNINPEAPDGNAIEIWSELMANLDEALIAAYQAVDPNTATGLQLERIGEFSGIKRQGPTASTAAVTFTGSEGVTIPAGTEVRNADTGTVWVTDVSAAITGGTASVGVTCQALGAEPAGAGDLSVIGTPIAGVSSVTNADAASPGRNQESTAAFRTRRSRSVAAPGSNQVDSIVGLVANVTGVKHVRVYENVTGAVDANGLAGHSIAIFVDGGDISEIAQAVAVKKSPGCSLNADTAFPGKIQFDARTEQGSPLQVTLFRPELVTVHVTIEVEGSISSGAIDAIKHGIVEYSTGEMFGDGSTGFDRSGFGIGQVLGAGKLYTPTNKAVAESGTTNSIFIGASPLSVTLTTINPGFNGLVVFDADNITVTVI